MIVDHIFSMHFDVSISCSKAKGFSALTGFFSNGSVVFDTKNMTKQALKII